MELPKIDFKRIFREARKKGCSVKNCKRPVHGIGENKPYCKKHFWQKFDELYPE